MPRLVEIRPSVNGGYRYPRRDATRPPNETVNYEEALQVYNEDLAALTPSELENEKFRAARIAALNPRALVHRGMFHITVRQWADERIRVCHKLLAGLTGTKPQVQQPRKQPKPWV
ncbi:MAG: hypothetical protein M1274_15390 [Actinobacteria bacterium]|nr:hypothetical protein [Actinomycetota bacterium]